MASEQRWPDVLWLVRHGESAGNVARDRAEADGLAVIDIAQRDMDVALSSRGEEQAEALGRWFAEGGPERKPNVVLTSPYVRAQTTAGLVLRGAGIAPSDVELVCDERLREREFGVLDRLTKAGIKERFPEQAELRAHVGKFYHRPPGGESWVDVAMRVRSVLETISRDYRNERVLVVSHQVVLLMFRYVLEQLSEGDILAIASEDELANCSVGEYEHDPAAGRAGALVRARWNHASPVAKHGAEVTAETDAPVAPR